jgi:RNA polymerase sigma-70 factor (ECF subfamily)
VGRTYKRLRLLARKMLRRYERVREMEQTDDVLQGALVRLSRALAEVRLNSAKHYYNLAAVQIRRELLDLAAKHTRPLGEAANRCRGLDDGIAEAVNGSAEPRYAEPGSLEDWSEFHRQAGLLPEEESEVFNLLWYHEMSQEQAAAVLGVSARTVKRRWQSARLILHARLSVGPAE